MSNSNLLDPAAPGPVTAEQQALFERCLREAAMSGEAMMATLAQEAAAFAAQPNLDGDRRERMMRSCGLLSSMAARLGRDLPAELTRAFTSKLSRAGVPNQSVLRYDQLELMNESQVEEKMELARAQAGVAMEVDAELTKLTPLMCGLQGYKLVQPERNPLRPELYIESLQQLFRQAAIGTDVSVDWLHCLAPALGRALRTEYVRWIAELEAAGVMAAEYAVHGVGTRTVAGEGQGVSRHGAETEASSGQAAREHDARLTVQQLRRLVMGDFDMRRHGDSGDPTQLPPSGDRRHRGEHFENTLPAAMQTLEEMNLVEDALQRLAQRKNTELRPAVQYGRHEKSVAAEPAYAPSELAELPTQALYAQLRRESRSIGQVLSLEVVALMIENIVNDARLLKPLRDVVAMLESPLLRLVVEDQRFFSDKDHPARKLLDAITKRSAGYDAADNPAFVAFLQPLRQAVQELTHVPIENAEPFELTLNLLTPIWDELQQREREQQAQAVRTLMHAEQRNIEAMAVANELQQHADAAIVPPAVLDFATGAWAQVIAQARVLGKAAEADMPGTAARLKMQASEYTALMDDVFWSVCPQLVGADTERLVRLIPGMLNKLRVGLKSIDYPQKLTSQFFDQLMACHQRSLQRNVPTIRRQAVAEPEGSEETAVPAREPDAQARASEPPRRVELPVVDAATSLREPGAAPGKAASPVAPPAAPLESVKPLKAAPAQAREAVARSDNLWLAPSEAKSSGFMEDLGIEFGDMAEDATVPQAVAYDESKRASSQFISLEQVAPTVKSAQPGAQDGGVVAMAMDPSLNATDLRQGEWVNLIRGGAPTRAQLIWVSPEQTMYMFTTSTGRNQSMSRGTLDRLIQQGNVQILVAPNVMDQAFNAVAQTALRNSVALDPGKPAKPR